MAEEGPIAGSHGVPFLLCVAQHRQNKNIRLAIQIFKRLLTEGDFDASVRLLIIGMEGPETGRIQRFIRESCLEDRVMLLRGVSEAQLAWCYGHCELLLAPSLVEGFGLPVVEAMLHRCRIVCSDIPAFREVGGSYCHFARLGPGAEDAFVQAARGAMRSRGFRRSTVDCFSGTRVAAACVNLYQQLRRARVAEENESRRR